MENSNSSSSKMLDEIKNDYEKRIKTLNDEIEVIGLRPTQKTVITGIEMFRKSLDEGRAGDNAGLLLRGLKKEDVERGQVLAKPGSVTPHTEFECELYVLTKDEGGRHTPFFTGYKPQFYIRTCDVTGEVTLPEGTESGRTVGAGVVTKIIQ